MPRLTCVISPSSHARPISGHCESVETEEHAARLQWEAAFPTASSALCRIRNALFIRLLTVPSGIPSTTAASRCLSPWNATRSSTCLSFTGMVSTADRAFWQSSADSSRWLGSTSAASSRSAERLPLIAGTDVARRGAETDCLVSPVAPQEIGCLVVGDRIEPGSQRAARHKLMALEVQLEESRLKGVLGQLGVAEVAAEITVHLSLKPPHQLLERQRDCPFRRSPIPAPHPAAPTTVWSLPRGPSSLRSELVSCFRFPTGSVT